MTPINRRPLVGGNWKMHMVSAEARELSRALVARLDQPLAEVVLFPSAPLLPVVAEVLAGSPLAWGGQDIHVEDSGAYTGDVSGPQLADVGCSWALCGHSERRRDHGESDELVGNKALAANRNGLTPLICLGETLTERQDGDTFSVLERQLNAALAGRPDPFALAYEPVWAIGTGETATPEIAQEAHHFLRETLADLIGEAAAAAKRILYGGSANPQNVADLMALPDVDGFLVGGASLDPEKISTIIGCCGEAA
jgi:triosephosphate isomerase